VCGAIGEDLAVGVRVVLGDGDALAAVGAAEDGDAGDAAEATMRAQLQGLAALG
jgi:hypothetical protein